MKIKKIFFVLIATVAIIATLAINTFAYSVGTPDSSVYFTGVDPIIPSSSCRVQKTNGYTLTPTSIFIPNITSSDGSVLYIGGNVDNSVRTVVRYSTNNISTYLGGVLEFWFTSSNDFEFTIDFGNILTSYAQFMPPDSIISPALHIGVSGGYYDLFNSQNLPYGDYLSMTYGSDLSVCSTYQMWDVDNNNYGGFTSYIDEGYTVRNNLDTLFIGNSRTSLNTVSGRVVSSADSNYGYNSVCVAISTYGMVEYEPYYFSLFGYYVPNVPNFYSVELNRRANYDVLTSVGNTEYNRGYNSGYTTGVTNGYNSGLGVGRQEGYTEGFNNGVSEGYRNGYQTGEEEGYTTGYDEGYNQGVANAVEERGIFKFFIDSLGAFMDFPLFPLPGGDYISLGLLLGVIVGAMALVWLLKLIAGG